MLRICTIHGHPVPRQGPSWLVYTASPFAATPLHAAPATSQRIKPLMYIYFPIHEAGTARLGICAQVRTELSILGTGVCVSQHSCRALGS